jgi:hypothetical protein
MAAPAYRANPPPFGYPEGDVFADSKRPGRYAGDHTRRPLPICLTISFHLFPLSHSNSHDAYPDEKRRSGPGNVGFHLMNADFDDDEDYDPAMHSHIHTMPALAAPQPGYAAPIAALNARQASPGPQTPMPNPHGQQPRHPPAALVIRPPVAPISVPSTPHPLPPTMTPIQPVFARPDKQSPPQVRFGAPILRSGREDTIARRGEKGDDFWRRFSMIAKEPDAHKERCATIPDCHPQNKVGTN